MESILKIKFTLIIFLNLIFCSEFIHIWDFGVTITNNSNKENHPILENKQSPSSNDMLIANRFIPPINNIAINNVNHPNISLSNNKFNYINNISLLMGMLTLNNEFHSVISLRNDKKLNLLSDEN